MMIDQAYVFTKHCGVVRFVNQKTTKLEECDSVDINGYWSTLDRLILFVIVSAVGIFATSMDSRHPGIKRIGFLRLPNWWNLGFYSFSICYLLLCTFVLYSVHWVVWGAVGLGCLLLAEQTVDFVCVEIFLAKQVSLEIVRLRDIFAREPSRPFTSPDLFDEPSNRAASKALDILVYCGDVSKLQNKSRDNRVAKRTLLYQATGQLMDRYYAVTSDHFG